MYTRPFKNTSKTISLLNQKMFDLSKIFIRTLLSLYIYKEKIKLL